MSRSYEFHSPLPPEQLPLHLAGGDPVSRPDGKAGGLHQDQVEGQSFHSDQNRRSPLYSGRRLGPEGPRCGLDQGAAHGLAVEQSLLRPGLSRRTGGKRPVWPVPHPSGGKAAVCGFSAHCRIQHMVFIAPQCGDLGGGGCRGGAVSAPSHPRLQGH